MCLQYHVGAAREAWIQLKIPAVSRSRIPHPHGPSTAGPACCYRLFCQPDTLPPRAMKAVGELLLLLLLLHLLLRLLLPRQMLLLLQR